jgi:hypothetical protein
MNSLVRHHHNLVEEAGTHAQAGVSVLPKIDLRIQANHYLLLGDVTGVCGVK